LRMRLVMYVYSYVRFFRFFGVFGVSLIPNVGPIFVVSCLLSNLDLGTSKANPMFHVSNIKPYHGHASIATLQSLLYLPPTEKVSPNNLQISSTISRSSRPLWYIQFFRLGSELVALSTKANIMFNQLIETV
jgi:hypothetical protein